MHPVHPYLAAQLARARQEQLREDRRRAADRGPHIPTMRALRERLGWFLIDLGLHVVVARAR